MFSFFERRTAKSTKARAKLAFEKVSALESDSRAARSARVRMALLCRAALDKAFIDGAERTRAHEEGVASALKLGRQQPAPPVADSYFEIKVTGEPVFVYLPMEYAGEAFAVGSRYQRAEIDARRAIDFVQALADQMCRYELGLDEAFLALQFLRDEIASDEAGGDAVDGQSVLSDQEEVPPIKAPGQKGVAS